MTPVGRGRDRRTLRFLWGIFLTLLLPLPLRAGENRDTSPNSAVDPFDLEQLIQLAIQTDPKLIKLRGAVSISRIRERSAKDWRDPEIRIGYQEEVNLALPEDRTTRITRTRRERGVTSTDGTSSSTRNGSGRSRESERTDRTTTETTTRRVRRGAKTDRIIEETRERTTETSREFENSSDERRGRETERRLERSDERVTSRTVENRFNDFNRLTGDEELSFTLRLFMPNPWEQKARVNKARARTGLAQATVRAAEHELVMDIKEAYSKLKRADAQLRNSWHLLSLREAQHDQQMELGNSAQLDDIADTQSDLLSAQLESEELEFRFRRTADKLAALSGLADPGRISLASSITPRDVDVTGLDHQFLYQIAEGYRGELVELRHRSEISRFSIRESNAKKVPWLTFVEGSYDIDSEGSSHTSDSYGIRVGVTLPIFSWLKNHEHQTFKEKAHSLSKQSSATQLRVRAEVGAALATLSRVSRTRDTFERLYPERRTSLERILKDADEIGFRAGDAAYKAREALARLGRSRLGVHSFYNDAVLSLERALGVRLEEALSVATPTSETSEED